MTDAAQDHLATLHLRAVIKRAGLSRAAETGLMTFIERFGSALNLNVHLHRLVSAGAYTCTDETAQFHRVSAPSKAELGL